MYCIITFFVAVLFWFRRILFGERSASFFHRLVYFDFPYSILSIFFLIFLIRQTGKTAFVEHRTFLHLYRSFHRLWIFLVIMFQVNFVLCIATLWNLNSCSVLKLNWCYSLFSFWFQALTIIAFNKGKLNLDTFKILLSIGPTFAIMNFFESRLLLFCVISFVNVSSVYFSLMSLCCFSRLFGCPPNVWGLHHCKSNGYLKAGY